MYQDKVVLCGANSYEEKYYRTWILTDFRLGVKR